METGKGFTSGRKREREASGNSNKKQVLTFCFRRLHDSQAHAVRCLLSGSTLGRVMMGSGDGQISVTSDPTSSRKTTGKR